MPTITIGFDGSAGAEAALRFGLHEAKLRHADVRLVHAWLQPRRGKAAFQSRLDEIPGVGPKRKQALLRRFGSVKGIQQAGTDELLTVPGITRAAAEQIKAAL